jgi:uncharacterized HAD superfamily protein/hypoxanthine phosphoribosyltransferase
MLFGGSAASWSGRKGEKAWTLRMIQFRSIRDMNTALVRALPWIPRDLDLIVGIPRSGMLAANLLSMYLNLPFTDLDGLLEKRVIQCGTSRKQSGLPPDQLFERARRVLVIDDCVGHGIQMRAVRARLAAAELPYEILYAAVYVSPEGLPLVDIAIEEISHQLPEGYFFSWNVMHHPYLSHCCMDIDGVLCRDPKPAEDTEGEEYDSFLSNSRPLYLPTVEIGWLVTGRLEKYRKLTEEWLQRHGVRYRELLMLNLPNARARREAGGAGPFKADTYSKTGASLFIESDPQEAAIIAKRSGKGVLCVAQEKMIYPDLGNRLPMLMRRPLASVLGRVVRRGSNRLVTLFRRHQNQQFIRKAY